MSSQPAAPPSVSADGGAPPPEAPGSRHRRAKNRRYRRNRAGRSHTTVVSWNAEGLRKKIGELQRWLPAVKIDVLAVQEGQLPKVAPRIPGFQPPVVVRRARGRVTGAAVVKGGDVALYVRAGLHFTTIDDRLTAAADDTTEVCGIRLLGKHQDNNLTIINVYRPPIRATDDDRVDRFDPNVFPTDDKTLLVGDVNAHHPMWDAACEASDTVGDRIAGWMERVGWRPLNTGAPTFTSYRSGSHTAPDIAACSTSLARRATWSTGPDMGSDHLPMIVEVRSTATRPSRIRKARWAHHKADWRAFQEDCEAALTGAEPARTARDATTRLTRNINLAATRHIPKGARRDPRPWALHPELQEAVRARQEARKEVCPEDQESKTRWIQAKQHAARVEEKVSREQFREFVSSTLNRPASLGRVSKTLKKWEGAADEDHREGQAMQDGERLLVSDKQKADAFAKTYANVSRQVRHQKIDLIAKRKMTQPEARSCKECSDQRTQFCAPFTPAELDYQLREAKLKKAPGPDGVTNEMLRHLGPQAKEELLQAINLSWKTGEVPREWRTATVVPIPKAGKNKRLLGSYRPIALTSTLGKLMERLILARLTPLVESRGLLPPEQVGFRAGRSVEDNIGRLIQEVQDGWQRPSVGRKTAERRPDGTTAQKYVLVAFDFARAYDVVDHRLLRVSLIEQGLPLCLVRWVWQWLRDRRVKVEVNGTLSEERIFRAGLPQGSVLSPSLFLLWATPLVAALKRVPGCTPYLYADDTAVLCAGNTIETARDRAQQAADALTKWARDNKMVVSGEKTQLLVLSQQARDADGCRIKVDRKTVEARETLHLLGVTLDRLLHFGPHCRRLRSKVRPRTNHLRQLTGRSWGLDERILRTVANGYVRGAMEHAAAAWLPATAKTNLEILEVEMLAAGRVITGCPISTPKHAVRAEAGIVPVAARRDALAARLLAKAHSLPPGDPLRAAAEASAPRRLKSVTGWRDIGQMAWEQAGITSTIEQRITVGPPPWTKSDGVTISLDVGPLPVGAGAAQRRRAAELHLRALPQRATWAWTDGSAAAGVLNGGAGCLIEEPSGESHELREAAGKICSSYRAEMIALRAAITHLQDYPAHTEDPIVICTDSQSALATLRSGPAAQTTPLGAAIWEGLIALSRGGDRPIHLQWVPSHCELAGNESADAIAKDAAELPQGDIPVDVRTVYRAVSRDARARSLREWPEGWYQKLMSHHIPAPLPRGTPRETAVEVHQLRAGHWSGSAQYLHRIGRNPSRNCAQCSDKTCSAGRCGACGEEADTPEHILLHCPALMNIRLRHLGTIYPSPEEVRSGGVVAALGAAARYLQSHLAT